jgi:hypothetical protein
MILVHAISSNVASDSTSDIQWMPPGRNRIQPESFAEPFYIDVNKSIADRANADLQRIRSAAAAGQGNWPYIDFNHEDCEQAGEAMELFWGGDDRLKGGVRLRVKWSSAGAEAVKGRAFRSFSPSWDMNEHTRAFIGVGLNLGGLVNRSAFAGMAVSAKGQGWGGEVAPSSEPFFREVEAAMSGNRAKYQEAVATVMAKSPALFSQHCRAVRAHGKSGGRHRSTPSSGKANPSSAPFHEKVQSVMATGVPYHEAIGVAIRESPHAFAEHCDRVRVEARADTQSLETVI